MQPQALSLNPRILRQNPWNTNFVSPENEAKLDEALRRLGMFKPVIVRETDEGFEILGGEHRAGSAIRIGLDEIPVMNLGRIDDAKAKEIGLADNSRYGADDTQSLAELLAELGSAEDLAGFLPYTDNDLRSIFSSTSIDIEDLELEETLPGGSETIEESPVTRAPKTHQVMRFKVAIADAERITAIIDKIRKKHGFDMADDLTNAGDALVHIVLASGEQSILTNEDEA